MQIQNNTQKIPHTLLKKSDKVLFIVYLAIGDFTYMQNAFKAFSDRYPHLKIDLFVLESRCTNDESQWEKLKNYSLYDWLEYCGIFNKIYKQTYSPLLLKESVNKAASQNYPLVICFGTLHSEPTEKMAREIAGENNIVAGLKVNIKWYKFKYWLIKSKSWKNLDIIIETKPNNQYNHISEIYAHWFSQIGGINLHSIEKRYPFINIPNEWFNHTKNKVNSLIRANQTIVFINFLAKDPNRSWTIDYTIELIEKMQKLTQWEDSCYIINSTPDKLTDIKNRLSQNQLTNTVVFSAVENFFELPSVIKLCNLVITVETSIMHIANALNVPTIALMRLKTPEWEPLNKELTTVIWNKKDNHVISDIQPNEIINVL